MGLQMIIRMQLGSILGSPELAGVNMNGDLRIVGVLLGDDSGQANPLSRVLITAMLPISDYGKLVANNPKFGKADNNGVSELTVSLGMPGMPAPPNATPSGPAVLIAKINDKHALIGAKGQYDKFVAFKKLCTAGSDPFARLSTASDYPLTIHGNVQAASKAFGPMVIQKINEIKGQMTQIGGPGFKPAPAEIEMMGGEDMIKGVMDMYIGILEAIMEQVDSLNVALKPTPDVLLIKETIAAVPGSDAAAMLVADPQAPAKNELLGYLENGAGMNFAMKMNKPLWKKFTASMMDLLGTIGGQNLSAEDMASMNKLIADAMDSMGGSLAGTFAFNKEAGSLFEMNYVVSVADADKFNKMLDDSADMLKKTGLLDVYKGLGIEMDYTMQRNVGTYQGISIDSARLTMKSTEPNSPPGQMIDAMYGKGFDYRWGMVNDLCAVSIGGDVDAKVHKLIDLVKAGGPKEICSEVQEALKVLPNAEKADFLATYNYVRMLKMIGGMMPMGPGITMPTIDVPSKSNIAIAGTVDKGRAVIDIAFPKQHLSELVTAFMMFQQEMMKQQGAITTRATIATLEAAIQRFELDTGRYPTQEEGLMALANKPANNADGWNGPYTKGYMPKDAWNNDFIYKLDADGKEFQIISLGQDGKEGGEGLNADIVSGK